MCLGTTAICRSCRRETYIFYPGGRCGEVQPLPAWHRVRGHRIRNRRCHDCIRVQRRALQRANQLFIRDSRRVKSLRQYFRGERSNPYPDEEINDAAQAMGQNDAFLTQLPLPLPTEPESNAADNGLNSQADPNEVEDDLIEDHEDVDDYREHEEPEMSFYQWTVRSYEQDPTHNLEARPEEALETDLNNYEWYLRQYCTELQANDFRRRRNRIADSEFVFEHPTYPSFSHWLSMENEVCQMQGMNQLSNREAIGQYGIEAPEDVLEPFLAAKRRHFEENRRELCGHGRNEPCPIIERLRTVREETTKMMRVSYQYFPVPRQHPVRDGLSSNCRILTTRVAMEQLPTREQWQSMHATAEDCVRQMRAAMSQAPPPDLDWNELFAQFSEDDPVSWLNRGSESCISDASIGCKRLN